MAGVFKFNDPKNEDGTFRAPAYNEKPVAPLVGSVQRILSLIHI